MAQITVEITQWLRAPTSSLSQNTLSIQPYIFFTVKKKKKLLLHFKCRPLGTQAQSHPTGSTTPPGKQVPSSRAPVTRGRFPGRYSERPSPSQSKYQEPGPELSLWVSQMESLEAAGCSSVPLMSLTPDEQLNLSFFISKQGQWHVIHMF